LTPQWFTTFGTMLVGALFLTNWPTYQYVILDGPEPLIFYFIAAILAASVVASHPARLLRAVREPLVIWFAFFVITGLIWLLFSGNYHEEEMKQWRLRLLAFIFFMTSLLLSSEANRPQLAKVILVCALIAAINNWIDFLFPFNFVPQGLEYSNPGRGAGLLINANQAGHSVIIMIIAALPFLDSRLRGLALLAMLFGVYPTFSRGALLFGGAAIVLAALLGQANKRQLGWMALLAPVLVVIGLSMHELGTASGEINLANIEERIGFFVSGGQAFDESADERRYVISLAWRMFTENPLVGEGIGSTLVEGYGRGTHNMYLMLAAEQGLVGLLLYLSLLWLILGRGWRIFKQGITQQERDIGAALVLLAAYFTFAGLFSHNLLEEPYTLFLLAFLFSAERYAARNKRVPDAQSGESRNA